MTRQKKYQKQKKAVNRKWMANVLILMGIAALVTAILVIKNQDQAAIESAAVDELPEQQYDRLLEAGEPIFLFFHSNNCIACIEMMKTVEQVFPEFSGSVNLIDVNVYDERNQGLLRRSLITAIPTQIFVTRSGEQQVVMGAMTLDGLQTTLSDLSARK